MKEIKKLIEAKGNKDIFDDNGLIGNSGLMPPETGIFHITANYSSNGKVFAIREDEEWGETWERMTLERAKVEGLEIIPCHKCSKPAISLDHHWPYYTDSNYCEEHKPVKKPE